MKFVLATGIYPPSIGGPATYVQHLAEELSNLGHEVIVVTYSPAVPASRYLVVSVSKKGSPVARWKRYAQALREAAVGADIVEAFSSVSVGVPLIMARLKGPKLLLRLGGDFPWERATDRGYSGSLRAWFAAKRPTAQLLGPILRRFDHLIFSTEYQRALYLQAYRGLPETSVIENAQPDGGRPTAHVAHRPFRLLSFGRFVHFKNLPALVRALTLLSDVTLTMVGEGPAEASIRRVLDAHPPLRGRVTIRPPAHQGEKAELFASHDLLVIPSFTDISPNAALEARTAGLPVLLTEETGLSNRLTAGMRLADLRTPSQIAAAISACSNEYADLAASAAAMLDTRSWSAVAADHLDLFARLV